MEPENSPPPRYSKDEPGFEDVGLIDLTPAQNLETEKLRAETIKKLERQKIESEMKPAEEIRPIPVELPTLFFRYGAKVIGCERFNTDPDENRMIAKHLTVIFGKVDSRIFSAFIIIVIVVGKVVACKDAIMAKMGKKKQDLTVPPRYTPSMDLESDQQKIADATAKHENKVQKMARKLREKRT